MSTGTDQYDERVHSLIVAALTAAMGAGPWNGDIDGDTITTERPWGVLQTDSEGGYYLASERTRDEAMSTCRACVMQHDKYAWWPLAIIDTESGAIEVVEVKVDVTAPRPSSGRWPHDER